MIAASCDDFRRAAQRRLPRFLFDYLDGGANRETTLGRNIRDLQDVALEQRVLRDVSRIDLSTTCLERARLSPLSWGRSEFRHVRATRRSAGGEGRLQRGHPRSRCRRCRSVRSRKSRNPVARRSGSSCM
jgi:hypothetical protein